MSEEDKNRLEIIEVEQKAIKDKFSLVVNVLLVIMALQVAASIYNGYSQQSLVSEFLTLKEKQFNQVIASEKTDPIAKLEEVQELQARQAKAPKSGRISLVFSVGVHNEGNTPASDLKVKVLFPGDIQTEFQSFDEQEYPYEMLGHSNNIGMYIPPKSTFRHMVVVPLTSHSVAKKLLDKKYKVKLKLYSKYGLEDTRTQMISITK
ncbi:hypothetical protein MHO82_11270 [Vibrio sp. Of7-15]|uniref:hypothetical protein n=1 Tax=Vibrio sp. Of7-15 TaxID=2724879 RepID=UPI001EF3B417|nr:hypothetical protein [Vibrio sp. Of7-15]MCG7497447.1 hypothetical protein [Vibrio sp. Of7-15]